MINTQINHHSLFVPLPSSVTLVVTGIVSVCVRGNYSLIHTIFHPLSFIAPTLLILSTLHIRLSFVPAQTTEESFNCQLDISN